MESPLDALLACPPQKLRKEVVKHASCTASEGAIADLLADISSLDNESKVTGEEMEARAHTQRAAPRAVFSAWPVMLALLRSVCTVGHCSQGRMWAFSLCAAFPLAGEETEDRRAHEDARRRVPARVNTPWPGNRLRFVARPGTAKQGLRGRGRACPLAGRQGGAAEGASAARCPRRGV